MEQTKGWSSIQPVSPRHFQIKDPSIRAAEFILDLDVTRIILERQKLLQEQERIKADWANRTSALKLIAKEHAAILFGVPESPTVSWPPDIPFGIGLAKEGQTIPLWQQLQDMKNESAEITMVEIPRTGEVIDVVEKELSSIANQLRYSELFLNQLREEFTIKQEASGLVKKRITAISLDLQRNKDVQLLLKLGGKNYESIGDHRCPTCKQSIPDSLVPNPAMHPSMSLDENVVFLDEQRKTLEGLYRQSQAEAERAALLVQAQEKLVNEMRSRIRILKETLVQDGHTPSIEAIQRRLLLERSISELDRLNEMFENVISEFEPLSKEWNDNIIALKKIKGASASQEDEKKIQLWIDEFRNGLRAFGFSSLAINDIELSKTTFRPENEDSEYKVSNACSASDGIRMTWAYLIGLLTVARLRQINHAGFLIFDEPRQQNANHASFSGLMIESAKAKNYRQQVIIFTSENQSILKEKLDQIPRRFTVKRIRVPNVKTQRSVKKRKIRRLLQYSCRIVSEKNYSFLSFEKFVITKTVCPESDDYH